jgi:hypothetical protein
MNNSSLPGQCFSMNSSENFKKISSYISPHIITFNHKLFAAQKTKCSNKVLVIAIVKKENVRME